MNSLIKTTSLALPLTSSMHCYGSLEHSIMLDKGELDTHVFHYLENHLEEAYQLSVSEHTLDSQTSL